MKKNVILVVLLFLSVNFYCQTVIVVKPKSTNYMGEALNKTADRNLEYAKLKRENAEFEQKKHDEELKKQEELDAVLEKELIKFDSVFDTGKFDEALVVINEFIANHPDHLTGYYLRGFTRYKLNNFVGTIADCNKCIAIFPKCEYAFLLRGVAKEKLEDLDEALKDFDKCISLNNSNKNDINVYNIVDLTSAFYKRGLLKIKLGKNGCSDLKKAEELGHDEAYEMVKKYCN